jgi:hypothetical protein
MTRRDLQLLARDRGRPWELGKAFVESAPIGYLHPVTSIGHPVAGAIWVQVDGEERPPSDIPTLIWSSAEVVANLSTFFELRPGDLNYTGTPKGVGKVEKGQTMRGGIDGLGELSVPVEWHGRQPALAWFLQQFRVLSRPDRAEPQRSEMGACGRQSPRGRAERRRLPAPEPCRAGAYAPSRWTRPDASRW